MTETKRSVNATDQTADAQDLISGLDGQRERELSLRTCIACRTVDKRENLLRLAVRTDNEVVVDEKGDLGGRGAYVCNIQCLKKALKENKIKKALRKNAHQAKTSLLKKTLQESP